MKQEQDALDNALESAEKKWKESKRVDKTKDKENHDLQQENGKVTESYDIVRKELKELTLQVKKDKNEQDKKLKKEQKKQEKVNNLQPIPENIFLCYKCDLCTDSMNKLREHIRIKHSNSLGCQTVEIELKDKSVQCQDAKPVEPEDNETKKNLKSIHAIIATSTLLMSTILMSIE